MRRAVLLLQFLFLQLHAEEWRWSNPRPHGNNIISMAFDGSLVWQVGDNGRVYTSADLDFWIPRQTSVKKSLRSLTFYKGTTYIAGADGLILTARSPKEFASIHLRTADWLEGITASPDLLVAVGDRGAIYTSETGNVWSRKTGVSAWLRSVAYGAGRFMAVGEDGFIATSQNGTNWAQLASGTTQHLNHISYSFDRFWIAGNNGTLLTNGLIGGSKRIPLNLTNNLYSISSSTNEVLVAGDSLVLLADPAFNFPRPQTNGIPAWSFFSTLWDGRLFLVGGRSGYLLEGFRTNSRAPITWYSQSQVPRNWLWDVCHIGPLFTAVGASGTILTSFDGVNWEEEITPSNTHSEILTGVGGNTNLLIAVGTSGTILYSPNVLTNILGTDPSGNSVTNTVSLWGILWQEVTPRPTTLNLQAITERQGLYVAAGAAGTILTSPDGSNWVQRTTGTTAHLSGITAYPNGFLASGDAGTLLQSTNGTTWTRLNSGVTNWIYSVRYLNGSFLAVGESGLILTSSNGHLWTTQVSGTTLWLNSVTQVGSRYVAVGDDGIILSSSDSVNWGSDPSITSRSLYGIAAAPGWLITVGSGGSVLRKRNAPFHAPVQLSQYDHKARISAFLFSGTPGQRFDLQATTLLPSGWSLGAELEILAPDGTLLYNQQETDPARFFRTAAEP